MKTGNLYTPAQYMGLVGELLRESYSAPKIHFAKKGETRRDGRHLIVTEGALSFSKETTFRGVEYTWSVVRLVSADGIKTPRLLFAEPEQRYCSLGVWREGTHHEISLFADILPSGRYVGPVTEEDPTDGGYSGMGIEEAVRKAIKTAKKWK